MSDFDHQRTTPQDARTIATWVRMLRPEWDTPGIMAALRQRADASPARLALAALACAASGEAKYPTVIAMDGAHWRVGQDTTPADRHPSHVAVRDLCWICSRPKDQHPSIVCDTWIDRVTRAAEPVDSAGVAQVRAALTAGRSQFRDTTTRQQEAHHVETEA